MDLLIIGAGLSGATVAYQSAKKGKKVLVLESRDVIGGNTADEVRDDVLIHVYGPHIFHTNNEEVYKFMNNFWELNNYKNRVEGVVVDELISIPFNFKGIEKFWPNKAEDIKTLLKNTYGENTRVTIADLLKSKEVVIKEIAEFVYKNIFENYTTKMWNLDPSEIDSSVLARVPVVIGYETRYFSDKYEGLPKDGYSNAIKKMLTHENIEVRLNIKADEVLKKKDSKIFFEDSEIKCPIIYTGPIDELFNYKHGELPYRSLKIDFEKLKINKFQNTAVVNYPAHPTMTRISEYKLMTGQEVNGTIISKEYPGDFKRGDKDLGTRFYPNPTDKAREDFAKYAIEAKQYPNLKLLGRLAGYKYLNMDQVIAEALEMAKEINK